MLLNESWQPVPRFFHRRAWMLMQIIKARFSVLTTWVTGNSKKKKTNKQTILIKFYRSSCNFCTLRFFGSLHLQKLIWKLNSPNQAPRRHCHWRQVGPRPSRMMKQKEIRPVTSSNSAHQAYQTQKKDSQRFVGQESLKAVQVQQKWKKWRLWHHNVGNDRLHMIPCTGCKW